jgi:hypothetical protein
MREYDMSDFFEVPLCQLTEFCTFDGKAALRDICTPYEEAGITDIVGLAMDVDVNHDDIHIRPLEHTIQPSNSDDTTLQPFQIEYYSEAMVDKIAMPLMKMQAAGLDTPDLISAIQDFDADEEDVYRSYEIIAMPNFAIISRNDYQSCVIDRHFEHYSDADEGVIHKSLLLVQTTRPESAHERLEAYQELKVAAKLINAMHSFPSPTNRTKTAPLILPKVSEIPFLAG